MYNNFHFIPACELCRISSILISFALLCLFSNGVQCHETNMEKELILTFQEKMAFDKFKSQIYPSVSQMPGFIKTDLFLLRWIRAKNLDVKRAVRDMHECLEWRKTNKIDNIQNENWEDMISQHPYRFAIDLQGRPVAIGSIGGQWDIRRSVIQGKMPRLARYAFKLVEEAFQRTYEINQKHPNVTQFSAIVSLEGFNLLQQACPLCLTTYVQLLSVYNRFYPNFAHAIIAINTPPSFNVILDLVRPMLNKGTRDALRIYAYNQRQWKPVLDNEVSEDQLTREFGGTRPDDDDYS